ncbi:MAG: response regulator [Planctomycetota bacterium]|nr:MAG: response regulator [Planctomycetota bacterium]REJ93497.1 MAG: response regulator [Planctomycetota bacterium]REK26145.1 MAG: response regulator [Planctomycetota bacterium]REK33514.1 MAG: response regulator [Planctomycetota bacterium]
MVGFTPPDAIVNRVLIVEDDRDEADFLRDYLQRQGMTVDVARDGGQAHASFSMHLPDLVLLDVMLPNVSGFEVCEQLKRINDTVPVMFLTAVDMDDARDLARRVGADEYMTKPYDPDELLSTIHQVSNTVWSRVHQESDSGVEGEKIRFECGECGKRLRVSSAHRGRTLNCPRCGQSVIVPRHV